MSHRPSRSNLAPPEGAMKFGSKVRRAPSYTYLRLKDFLGQLFSNGLGDYGHTRTVRTIRRTTARVTSMTVSGAFSIWHSVRRRRADHSCWVDPDRSQKLGVATWAVNRRCVIDEAFIQFQNPSIARWEFGEPNAAGRPITQPDWLHPMAVIFESHTYTSCFMLSGSRTPIPPTLCSIMATDPSPTDLTTTKSCLCLTMYAGFGISTRDLPSDRNCCSQYLVRTGRRIPAGLSSRTTGSFVQTQLR